MKRLLSLFLCLCLVFLLCSCSSYARDLTDEEFKRQIEIYGNKIKNAGFSFELSDESILRCQHGDCFVTYSINTSTYLFFCVNLEFINIKKAKLEIVFYDAKTDWNTENTESYASLIKAVTNSGLSYEQIRDGVKKMEKETSMLLSLNSALEWDNYHSDLYYTERIFFENTEKANPGIFEKIIFVFVLILQAVNTFLVLFRSIQKAVFKKKKSGTHILAMSAGLYWFIFVLSVIASIAVLGNIFEEKSTDLIIIVSMFIAGHIFCTYLLFSQLFWRIGFSGETVTVCSFLKKASYNRKDLQLKEKRFTICLMSGEKKLADWDCRCMNIKEEANFYRFILNGKEP